MSYNFGLNVVTTSIYYTAADGSWFNNATQSYQFPTGGTYSFTVLGYDTASGNADPAFKEWKVNSIAHSGGNLGALTLQAVMYTQSTVTYVLDGGSNNASNPDFYYEGKQAVTLSDASKEGYDFDGWYSDNAYTRRITELSSGQTGNVVLYAKFTEIQRDEVPETGDKSIMWLFPVTLVSGLGMLFTRKKEKEIRG